MRGHKATTSSMSRSVSATTDNTLEMAKLFSDVSANRKDTPAIYMQEQKNNFDSESKQERNLDSESAKTLILTHRRFASDLDKEAIGRRLRSR